MGGSASPRPDRGHPCGDESTCFEFLHDLPDGGVAAGIGVVLFAHDGVELVDVAAGDVVRTP